MRLELFVWPAHLPVPGGSGIFYSKQDWLVSPPPSQPHLQQRDAPEHLYQPLSPFVGGGRWAVRGEGQAERGESEGGWVGWGGQAG